ncbi:MAG: HAD family hydrolase [Clostridiales bacterium]|nr:HAD family hydrolase [Clostridiales bacterium]
MKDYPKKTISDELLEKINILAFDIDDTLLDSQGRFSERNRKALLRAMEKGFHVVIASGRMLSTFPRVLLDFPGIEYAVSSNGAQLTELASGRVLFEQMLGEAAIDAVRPWLVNEAVMTEIFFDHKVYAERSCFYELEKYGRGSEKSREYVFSTRIPADNLMELLEANKARIENIYLQFGDLDLRSRYLEELSALEGVTVSSSSPTSLELGGPGTSKGSALAVLAEELGEDMSAVMAFGDSTNDKDMLLRAGIGVALGNAVPEILAAADYIAPSNDEDGVAFALWELLGI